MPDYNTYVMGIKQRIFFISIAASVIFAAGFLFYRSVLISLLLTPLALLYPKIKTKEIIKRRKRELNIQFGHAVFPRFVCFSRQNHESAFRTALDDLSVLSEPSAYVLAEIRNIISRLDTNETLESALFEFAGRAGIGYRQLCQCPQYQQGTGGNVTR